MTYETKSFILCCIVYNEYTILLHIEDQYQQMTKCIKLYHNINLKIHFTFFSKLKNIQVVQTHRFSTKKNNVNSQILYSAIYKIVKRIYKKR